MHVSNAPQERTDQQPVDAEWLVEHLVHDHDRLPREIAGLPLRALHDLEHFEQSFGLLDLHHRHRA
jgi:hypothetical protein